MSKKTWLSMSVCAKKLKVSRQVVNGWIKNGNIKWKYDENVGMRLVDPDSLDVKTIKKGK